MKKTIIARGLILSVITYIGILIVEYRKTVSIIINKEKSTHPSSLNTTRRRSIIGNSSHNIGTRFVFSGLDNTTEEGNVKIKEKHLSFLPSSLNTTTRTIANRSQNNNTPEEEKVFQKEKYKAKEYYLRTDAKTGHGILLQNDLSSLVDIAYIGHSKCGSTSIHTWLHNHSEILIRGLEDIRIMGDGPIGAVKRIFKKYIKLSKGRLIAYESPAEIFQNDSLHTLQTYFPRTKLLIGIRHPILWFESFYNFWESIMAGPRKHLPSNTTKLIGPCLVDVNEHVCTDHARFHLQIAKVLGNHVGTTTTTHFTANTTTTTTSTILPPIITDREVKLLGIEANVLSTYRKQKVYNPLFLYEISQLSDSNDTRNENFREDLRQFLGVQDKFLKAPRINVGSKGTSLRANRNRRINICDASHQNVRAVLMEHSRNTAAWIREFLLYNNNDVMISSKEYVEEILETYNHDPCDNSNQTKENGKARTVEEKERLKEEQ